VDGVVDDVVVVVDDVVVVVDGIIDGIVDVVVVDGVVDGLVEPDNKLYLHVGHVLFTRNHRDKLVELNMCPHCRMRDTR
jgi:hypothetical protein